MGDKVFPLRRPKGWMLLAACAVALMLSCARPPADDPELRPLTGREILALVARSDKEPLPDVEGVEIFEVGQYEEEPFGRMPGIGPEADELCPSARYRFVSHSRQVQAEPMRVFGFTFRLMGHPRSTELGDGRAVPLMLEVRHPAMVDPVSGDLVRVEQRHMMGCVGEIAQALYQFDSDWMLVSGDWTLNLMLGDRVLASKTFQVVGGRAPDTLSAALAESIQDQEQVAEAPPLRTRIALDKLPPPAAEEKTVLLAETDEPGRLFERAVPPVAEAEGRLPSPSPLPQGHEPQSHGKGFAGTKGIFVLASSNMYVENAERHARELRQRGWPADVGRYVEPASGRVWHTVRIGRYGSMKEASAAAREFSRRTGLDAFVVVRREETLTSAQTAPAQRQQKAETSAAAPEPQPRQEPSPIAMPEVPRGGWAVQVGAYLEPGNAFNDAASLQTRGWPGATVHERLAKGRLWHTVLLGRHGSEAAAEGQAERFRRQERRRAFVVAAP